MHHLKSFLDRLYEEYHRPEYLSSDPLEFVHRWDDPWDQELVALLSGLLAYGNVKQIRRSIGLALECMSCMSCMSGDSSNEGPSQWVRGLASRSSVESAEGAWKNFVHRFNRGDEILLVMRLIGRSWDEFGSVGSHFLSFHSPQEPTIEKALSAFIGDWKLKALEMNSRVARRPSFQYLLNSPSDGSCCKRWCMILRWMGRLDTNGMDPGLWTQKGSLSKTFSKRTGLHSRQLVMPLDTHTGRISQYLGLTQRKSLNWKAALEITQALAECDPEDPTRYDFALARLGILDLCQRKYRAEICAKCQLLPVCTYSARKS